MPSIANSTFGRSTTLMQSDSLLLQLRRTNTELQDRLNEITTGKSLDRASDEPSKVSAVQFLRQKLLEREQQEENLQYSLGILNVADQGLGEMAEIMREAQTLAMSQIGVGSDTDTRRTQATVVDAQFRGLLEIANRHYNEVGVFAGNSGVARDGLENSWAACATTAQM